MRELYRRVVDFWPVHAHAWDAIDECSRLSASVAVSLLRGRSSGAGLAAAIADMEVICERLRMIVGDGLVDIEKVESLQRLQGRLVQEEQRVAALGEQSGDAP
ncbi:MAG: hypothetical protein ACREXZ_23770 [Paraburkholderia sp.]